jgi:hypothetical protein
MNSDDLQKTWQSQELGRRITIDADLLLREVRQNNRQFQRGVFWRDVREAGLALLLAPALVLWTEFKSPDDAWPLYLVAAAVLAIGIFIILDRLRQKRKRPAPGDTLLGWAESSLADVEHQVWLLRNVFWWYLLPPTAAIAVVYSHATWECRDLWKAPFDWVGLLLLLAVWIGTAAVFYGVYRLNQWWVKKEGEPRRQELKGLVENLKSLETTAA